MQHELDVMEHDLAIGQHNFEPILAAALAIERDPQLRTAFGRGTTGVALGSAGPYVIVEDGVVTSSAMLGPAPRGLDRVVTLPEALALCPDERISFERTLRATEDEAERLFATMQVRAEVFTQRDFASLERWAPLLALHAYRHAATIQTIFDAGRGHTGEPTRAQLRTYWERVHLLGHLTILATAAQPTDWLAEMAHTFTWKVWTPSFPLVRERILRLAVRGGWAAARFGATVTAPYLARLEAGQPMHAFDAVLGLVAVAATTPSERNPIAYELAKILAQRTREPNGEIYAALARTAQLALFSTEAATRHVIGDDQPATLSRLAAAVDSDDDCGTFDGDGYFPAILAIASLAAAPASILFAPAEQDPDWHAIRATDALARTHAHASWTN